MASQNGNPDPDPGHTGDPGGYGNKTTSNRGRGHGEYLGQSHISDREAGKSMVELRKTGVYSTQPPTGHPHSLATCI